MFADGWRWTYSHVKISWLLNLRKGKFYWKYTAVCRRLLWDKIFTEGCCVTKYLPKAVVLFQLSVSTFFLKVFYCLLTFSSSSSRHSFHFFFSSVTCVTRQFLHQLWQIPLTFLPFLFRTFLSSLTLCNISSFFTRSVQLIFSVRLQHYISKLHMVILYIKEKCPHTHFVKECVKTGNVTPPILNLRVGGDEPSGRCKSEQSPSSGRRRTTALWHSGNALGSKMFQTGLQIDDWVSSPCWTNFFSSLVSWSLSSTAVKNEWRYTSTPLCGVHAANFIYCSCSTTWTSVLSSAARTPWSSVRTPFVMWIHIFVVFLPVYSSVCLARDRSPIQGVRP